MKTIKSKIQPNPKECERWVDLSTDPMGGVVKYFNGNAWAVVGGTSNGSFLTASDPEIIELEEKVDSLDKEMGQAMSSITEFEKIIPEKLDLISLEIGDNSSVRTRNLKKLITGQFFTTINYGYGVGTWNSSTGGHAHIVTAYGNTVYYIIGTDGSVIKETETPDIYYDYINAGGTKTMTEFIVSLKDIIDKNSI